MSPNRWRDSVEDIMEELDAALREHDSATDETDEITESVREASYYLEKAVDCLDNAGSYMFYTEPFKMSWRTDTPVSNGLYYIRTKSKDWVNGGDFLEISVFSFRDGFWGGQREADRIVRASMVDWCHVEHVKGGRKK